MTRSLSLRTQLSLAIGSLALAILGGVGLYLGHVAADGLYAAQQAAVRATAQAAAELLATQVQDRRREIQLLSAAPYLTAGPLATAQVRTALELRQSLQDAYAWMGVASPDGEVLQATSGLLVGRSVASRDWFLTGRERISVGDVREAKLLAGALPPLPRGEPPRFIDVSAPVLDSEGRLRAVVGAHIRWHWVTGIIDGAVQRLHPGGGIEALVINREGHVLYPEALKLDEVRGEAVLPAALSKSPLEGAVRFGDGLDYLVSEAPLEARDRNELGWRIVARQPLEAALRPVQALRRELMLLGVLTAAALTLAALLLARRVSRPVEALARVARQVETERRVPDLPGGPQVQEVAQLGDAMLSMARALLATEHELQQSNARLESEVHARTAELQAANAALEHLAMRDPLTGLHNRRSLDARLVEAHALDQRYGHPAGRVHGLLLIDADHFKRINDVHGHPAGDAVLRQLASMLQGTVRVTDVAARFGGEEFAVLLPEVAGPADVLAAAEKIRAAVEAAEFPAVGRVTVSIGASLAAPEDADARPLIDRADAALYEAKRSGRNAVVLKAAG